MIKKFLFILIFVFPSAVIANQPAPHFSLPTLDGKTYSLSQDLGRKMIVINFWAAWCDACKEEVPLLESLKKKYQNKAVFLGINVGESSQKAAKFIKRNGFSYHILLDEDKKIAKTYKVLGIPQTFVISTSGQVVFRGSRPPKDLNF